MDIQVIVNQMIILFLVMIIGYIANKSNSKPKDVIACLKYYIARAYFIFR